jgi:hemoglobin-like flavoprotein
MGNNIFNITTIRIKPVVILKNTPNTDTPNTDTPNTDTPNTDTPNTNTPQPRRRRMNIKVNINISKTLTHIFIRNDINIQLKSSGFYVNNAFIHEIDYINALKSWNYIVDDNFNLLANANKNTNCLTLFYDCFFKNIYIHDTLESDNIEVIFPANIVFRSKALMNMVKNSISASRKHAHNEVVDYNKIYNIHKTLGIQISHFITICDILLDTLEECIGVLWNTNIKSSWKTIFTVIIQNLLIVNIHPQTPNISLRGILYRSHEHITTPEHSRSPEHSISPEYRVLL